MSQCEKYHIGIHSPKIYIHFDLHAVAEREVPLPDKIDTQKPKKMSDFGNEVFDISHRVF